MGARPPTMWRTRWTSMETPMTREASTGVGEKLEIAPEADRGRRKTGTASPSPELGRRLPTGSPNFCAVDRRHIATSPNASRSIGWKSSTPPGATHLAASCEPMTG